MYMHVQIKITVEMKRLVKDKMREDDETIAMQLLQNHELVRQENRIAL